MDAADEFARRLKRSDSLWAHCCNPSMSLFFLFVHVDDVVALQGRCAVDGRLAPDLSTVDHQTRHSLSDLQVILYSRYMQIDGDVT